MTKHYVCYHSVKKSGAVPDDFRARSKKQEVDPNSVIWLLSGTPNPGGSKTRYQVEYAFQVSSPPTMEDKWFEYHEPTGTRFAPPPRIDMESWFKVFFKNDMGSGAFGLNPIKDEYLPYFLERLRVETSVPTNAVHTSHRHAATFSAVSTEHGAASSEGLRVSNDDATSTAETKHAISAESLNRSSERANAGAGAAPTGNPGESKGLRENQFGATDHEDCLREADETDSHIEGFDGEDKEVIAKRRANQGKFRQSMLRYWKNRCCVSDVTDTRLLIASHIVPWSKCTKPERGDPANGLLLSVTWDALFDRGLISFGDDGRAIVEKLDKDLIQSLGIDLSKDVIRRGTMTGEHRVYLGRHRLLHGF